MKHTLFAIICLLFTTSTLGQDNGFTQEDRELLIKLNVKMGEFENRLGTYDERFNDLNNRMDDMNNRISYLATFVQVLSGVFGGMFIAMLSIIFWDRSTIVKKARKVLKQFNLL